jgi:hypothetical protein
MTRHWSGQARRRIRRQLRGLVINSDDLTNAVADHVLNEPLWLDRAS